MTIEIFDLQLLKYCVRCSITNKIIFIGPWSECNEYKKYKDEGNNPI